GSRCGGFEAGAYDLDLGKLGHPSSAPRPLKQGPRGEGRSHLRLLLAGPVSLGDGLACEQNRRVESLRVIRAAVGDGILRKTLAEPRAELLQTRLRIHGRAES